MARTIWIATIFFGLLKIGIALLVPVFGDEAYYVYWGSVFSGGYYDLPPMIGWWLWPLLHVSAHPLWLRLWNLLVPLLIAFGLYKWLRESADRTFARRAALLYLLWPLPFLAVFSFPDVPLTFFSFFSALLFCRGVRSDPGKSRMEMVASGALWGAAFLSKYFAVFLLPAFLIWAWPRSRNRLSGIFFFSLGAAPFLVQHVLWNSRHCWSNFVFNLVSRQRVEEGTPIQTTIGFLLNLFLVFLPLWASLVWPSRKVSHPQSSRDADLSSFMGWLVGLPLAIFGVTALLGRSQGVHWVLFLIPFAVAWAALRMNTEGLLRSVRISAIFSGAIGFGLLLVFAFPLRWMPTKLIERHAFDFGMLQFPEEFYATLAPRVKEAAGIFTESYSRSSVLHHQGMRFGRGELPQVGVWMSGSRFGRTFDWRVEWPSLEGKTIAFVKPGRIHADFYRPYFVSHEVSQETSGGANFEILLGQGFRAREFWSARVRPELELFYSALAGPNCPIFEFEGGSPVAR
jgi:hypothetical protein